MKKIHIIAGPTASGKSARALALAERVGGVIINADSQQLFRDLPILTARPTPEDEARAPHKLYGILGAHELPSMGKWLRQAKMEIDWVRSNRQTPIVVGGTGLYIRALMQGMAEIPDIDPMVRAQVTNDYEAMGKAAFEARLAEVDPGFFRRLQVYDRQRLLRAYEVWLGTGKSLSWWQEQGNKPPYNADDFELEIIEIAREELYQRCDQRFEMMMEMGALEEVRGNEELVKWRHEEKNNSLITQFLNSSVPLLKIIGVRELLGYLAGEHSIEQAIDKAKQMTRNYAKRQMTWFRNQLS